MEAEVDRLAQQIMQSLKTEGWPSLRERVDGILMEIEWALEPLETLPSLRKLRDDMAAIDREMAKEKKRRPKTLAELDAAARKEMKRLRNSRAARQRRASPENLQRLLQRVVEIVVEAWAAGERLAITLPLDVVSMMLRGREPGLPHAAEIATILEPLRRALDELDQGHQHPLLRPAPREGGRPRESDRAIELRLRCVLLANALTAKGMESTRANKEVERYVRATAKHVLGERGKYPLTAETIRRWRKSFAARPKGGINGREDKRTLQEKLAGNALEYAEVTGRLPSYIEALRRSLQLDGFEMPVGWGTKPPMQSD